MIKTAPWPQETSICLEIAALAAGSIKSAHRLAVGLSSIALKSQYARQAPGETTHSLPILLLLHNLPRFLDFYRFACDTYIFSD